MLVLYTYTRYIIVETRILNKTEYLYVKKMLYRNTETDTFDMK